MKPFFCWKAGDAQIPITSKTNSIRDLKKETTATTWNLNYFSLWSKHFLCVSRERPCSVRNTKSRFYGGSASNSLGVKLTCMHFGLVTHWWWQCSFWKKALNFFAVLQQWWPTRRALEQYQLEAIKSIFLMGAGVVTFWCALWKFDSDSLFLEAGRLNYFNPQRST